MNPKQANHSMYHLKLVFSFFSSVFSIIKENYNREVMKWINSYQQQQQQLKYMCTAKMMNVILFICGVGFCATKKYCTFIFSLSYL